VTDGQTGRQTHTPTHRVREKVREREKREQEKEGEIYIVGRPYLFFLNGAALAAVAGERESLLRDPIS
jgi:hypothetical protein